jgi:predicted MFS family arabinose efflux permease
VPLRCPAHGPSGRGWQFSPRECRTGRRCQAEAAESTFGEALRTGTFVIAAMVFLVMGALSSGLVVLQVRMLIDAGILSKAAAGLPSIVGVSMIVGRIGTGYLLDYFPVSHVLACFIAAASLAAVAFPCGISSTTAPIAAALIGLIIGAEFDALSYMIPRYYGHRAFGKIYGTTYAIFQLVGGLGIVAIGFSHDMFFSFRPSMCALAVLTILAALLFLGIGPYCFPSGRLQRPERPMILARVSHVTRQQLTQAR